MSRYRKIPVVIDAIQINSLDAAALEGLVKWVEEFGDKFSTHFHFEGREFKVQTLEGASYNVPVGYWIIRGVNGEYYPCAPDIFAKTYEEAI